VAVLLSGIAARATVFAPPVRLCYTRTIAQMNMPDIVRIGRSKGGGPAGIKSAHVELILLAGLCLHLLLPHLAPQFIEYYPGHAHIVFGATELSVGLRTLANHFHYPQDGPAKLAYPAAGDSHKDVTVVSVPDQQTIPDLVQIMGGPVLLALLSLLPLRKLSARRLQPAAILTLAGAFRPPLTPPPRNVTY
jgi:hypothetical protein